MSTQLDIAAEGTTGGGGSGPPPEDDPRFGGIAVRSQGLLTLAFGFALGVALVLLFWLISRFPPSAAVRDFVAPFAAEWVFLAGFIVGTITAGIYNLLVVRRVNLFGLESSMD